MTAVSPSTTSVATPYSQEQRPSRPIRVCLVRPTSEKGTETFIVAHAERLPAPVLSYSVVSRAWRKACRTVHGRGPDWDSTHSFLKAFQLCRADVVLAEYGTVGVRVMDACRISGIPLVVHFHGYDASSHDTLERHRNTYPILFREAAAIVAVSRAMQEQLVALGAEPAKVQYNPYGVDCDDFTGARPSEAPPQFIAVGRFVEKKAPHLTMLAFSQVAKTCPEARLTMIGDGPLWGACHDLARALGIEDRVTLPGHLPHDAIRHEMAKARAFVQHSVAALATGDAEGTPVSVLEAGASGLPVVATRHAGIPDVVIDGETGLLVDPWDVEATALAMTRLANDPQLAAKLGSAGRERVFGQFSMDRSIDRLWNIIESSVAPKGE